ncbi:MAG: hypothetical protein M3367_17155 [Acidobacteriota bacterium]|nr:hypothetical protein [Acidobacteriota bacterium]
MENSLALVKPKLTSAEEKIVPESIFLMNKPRQERSVEKFVRKVERLESFGVRASEIQSKTSENFPLTVEVFTVTTLTC